MKSQDDIGDLLRRFYGIYGRPEEGPPGGLNVAELLSASESIQQDLALIRLFLDNATVQRDFVRCREIHEQIATALADSTSFLQELQDINLQSEVDLEHLTNGVFWFTLASKLHPDAGARPDNLSLPAQIPEPFRRSLQIQGGQVWSKSLRRVSCPARLAVRSK